MKPKKAIKPVVISSKKNNKTGVFSPALETPFFLKPQNIFLVLATIFGLSFVFTIPPFQVPDEASHMFRAYQLSRLQLQVEEQNNVFGNYRPPAPDNKVTGNYLPASFDSAQIQFFHLKFRPQNKIKKKAIRDASQIELQPEKEKFIEMTAGNFFFFSYIPQLPAILLGRILDLNVLTMFYLGRLFALAFFILCVWYSIKIVPFGKYIFLVLGLIPMSLSLAGSYSADCVINSFSFLALALALNLMQKTNLNLKNKKLLFLILILSLFGVLKLIYLPWVLLILLIPLRAFESKKEYYLTIFISFLTSAIFALVWTYFLFHNQIHNANIVVPEVVETPAHQMHRILDDPTILFDIIRETLSVKGDFYYKTLIGILGYLDTMLPLWIYNFFYLLLIVVAVLDVNKTYQFSVFQRTLILVFSVGVFLATIFAMFIFDGWESKDSLVVEGVQGRYFIPALITACFGIYRILPIKKSLFESSKIAAVVLFIICFIVLYQTQHALYLRYFVEGDDYFKYINY